MYRLLYRAKAVFPHKTGCDADILRSSVRKNKMNNISGFLLRSDDYYFQVLEGPELKVKQLVGHIISDERQKEFTHLYSGKVQERLFYNWGMEIHILGREDLSLSKRLSLLAPKQKKDPLTEGTIIHISNLAYGKFKKHNNRLRARDE